MKKIYILLLLAVSAVLLKKNTLVDEYQIIDYEITTIHTNQEVVNQSDFTNDAEVATLTINKTGYCYSNNLTYLAESDSDNQISLHNVEYMQIGINEDVSDIEIKSWSDAQNYLESEILSLLQNNFILNHTDDFIIALSQDMVTATYYHDSFRICMQLSIVGDSSKRFFERGTSYPSELSNLHEIKIDEGVIWQCFSHYGYDGSLYQNAVSAKGYTLYDISFQGVNDEFIYQVLSEIKL